MGAIYSDHNKRIAEIKKLRPLSTIIEIWDCDYDKLAKTESELQSFLKENPLSQPLHPRDALFGGSTEALRLFYDCQPGEKIKYYDITSLYPAVQKYGYYPVGHPVIYTENINKNIKYFGIMKCSLSSK